MNGPFMIVITIDDGLSAHRANGSSAEEDLVRRWFYQPVKPGLA